MPLFTRYIAIDYSGAKTADDRLPGLRVYEAANDRGPAPVWPPGRRGGLWTRREIAEWLCLRCAEEPPALVGIDHGFSFPLAYFERHSIPMEWDVFLEDFHRHWPTDRPGVRVDDIRRGAVGHGALRSGERTWRRICEELAGGAKSVFWFDVQGSVAKSTHAGLPWLLFLRRRLGRRLFFWPFDGWTIPPGASCVAEIYPSLWRRLYSRGTRTPDQYDAYAACRRLREADLSGELQAWLAPPDDPERERIARVEGWILGVAFAPRDGERAGAGLDF